MVEDRPDRPGLPTGAVVVRGSDGRAWQSEHELTSNWDDLSVKRKFDACMAAAGLPDRAAVLWNRLLTGAAAELSVALLDPAIRAASDRSAD